MKLTALNTGSFKLDGGAMFGVVPKVMWNKLYPSDENNLCTWALRCLLIETENKKILIDCGIGDKQSEKFFSNYYIENYKDFDTILAENKLKTDDITDVIITHLHFDHCGGAVSFNSDKTKYQATFKNATYWIGKEHWDLANNPNKREKASFMKENFTPLLDAGQVKFIENDTELCKGVSLKLFYGHTDGQVIPYITYQNKTIVYMADFIPSSAHIPIPYVISYDTRPLVSMDEKEKFLVEALNKDFILFFEHDIFAECCNLINTEKGIRPNKKGKLEEFV